MSTKKSRRDRKRTKKSQSSGGAKIPGHLALAIPKPQAADGESTEDRALFDSVALDELPEVLQTQARQVISALDGTFQGNFAEANDQLREIPRSSPYADWRLLVRGLAAWYAADFESAKQTWDKLDPTRRPARIAAVLAANTPLAVSAENRQPIAVDQPGQPIISVDSAHQLSAAHYEIATTPGATPVNEQMVRLVEQLRVTRPALRLARKIADIRHRDPDVTLSAIQISLLLELRQGFLETESELVEQMTEACVNLAWQQPEIDTLKLLVKRLPGPAHDPNWTLALVGYLRRFEGASSKRKEMIDLYIKSDLPNISQVDPKLQSGLSSVVREQLAEDLAGKHRDRRDDIRLLEEAKKAYELAVAAYPTNRNALKGIQDCIERILDSNSRGDEPLKKDRDAADEQAAKAYANWLAALPDEIAPRLWLIDYYLANDNPAAANKLAEKLPISSLDNLRIKMLPWKIKLTEALLATQKKRSIPLAEVSLTEAISIWPKWLSEDFVPFLQSAWKLRAGDALAFESVEIKSLLESGLPSLVADVMKLAAAQMMSVEAAKLKPFREAVELHVNGVKRLSTEDLARLGSFYWDLKLCGMSYPALRMHGSKFGMELCSRLKSSQPDIPGLMHACLWMSEARFYANNGSEEYIPNWLEDRSLTDPVAAAAILRSRRLRNYAWRHLENRMDVLELVERAVKLESRPVERLIMEEAIKLSHDILGEGERFQNSDPFARFFGSRMAGLFGDDDDDSEDTCMCPNCVARRARQMTGEYDEDEDDEYEDDEDEDDDDEFDEDFEDPLSLQFRVIMEKIGEEAFQQISDLIEKGSLQDRDVMPEVRDILRRRGVTQQEFQEAVGYTQGKSSSPPKPPPPPPMSAEERRRNDKQRRKLLEQSRKRK